MNASHSHGGDSLPLEAYLRVDAICLRFEQAWRSGGPPSLEEYLQASDEREQTVLLRELLRLEVCYRRQRGDLLSLAEYEERFPAHAETVRLVLTRAGSENAAAEPGRVTAQHVPAPESSRVAEDSQPAPAGTLLGEGRLGTDRAGRNLLYEEIGRGGMGRVLRGRDPELRRDLAVKVLRPEHRAKAELVRRFVEEAQVSGQLQHPGVVPVYELGQFEDGCPFFTMKLVQGRTLGELLEERQSARDERARFLTIFEAVCQTVAYAHSQGVIHRDLKPSNVMVGAFGEVQVMDWGLAKVLASRERERPEEPAAGPEIGTPGTDSAKDEEGRTGVVGTPAFMPPEQARGQNAAVDERADVFGLGGVLCVILTGQPPFTGSNQARVLRQAAAGDVAEALARLKGCGSDPELVRLCRECLAPDRENRPRDARAVAERVASYQAAVQERLREAERERAAAEARAKEAGAMALLERRARRLTVGLAAAVLLLLAGGGGGTWWWQQKQQKVDTGVALAMSEVRMLLEQARTGPLGGAGRFHEALQAAQKGEELARVGGASSTVQRQARALVGAVAEEQEAAERDRRLLAALLEVRAPREGRKVRRGERGPGVALAEPSVDEEFAAAFREWHERFNVDLLSTAEAAGYFQGRPRAVVVEVVATLDHWASERRRRRLPAAKWQPAEALASFRRSHHLGSKTSGWRYPSADRVRECERLLELDRKLPAVLAGKIEPASPEEFLEFASCGRYKRLPVAAARLSAEAFSADPKLADDLQAGHRYNAACSAALAAVGQGADARLLPDKVVALLRRQALGWLRADLALYAELAERPEAAVPQMVRQRLRHWQQDADLASVRDKEALRGLPDDERQQWSALWQEVATLLVRVEQKK